MDKLIDAVSFSEDWEVTLLDLESPSSGLEKAAAADEVTEFVGEITPEEGKFYLHINAMGAGEYYGSNRNGDYFPEDNLLQWYKTFETSPAHVFRHHVNKDPARAIGKVIYSYYNPRMHRVELVAEVDKQLGAMELAAIEDGQFPMTSMACNTPYDVCSICNNKAHSRAEYCSHLTTQLNKIMPDGRRVMAINVGPLKFFDISIVIRPADVTSSVLQKVAGDEVTIGSAEAADAEGVSYGTEKRASIKKAALAKAADIVKEIPGEVEASGSLLQILEKVRDPDMDVVDVLKPYPLTDIISTLAHLGINPSVEFLVKILASKYVGSREGEIAMLAMKALQENGVESIPLDADELIPDMEDTLPNPKLINILYKYMETSSYQRDYVEKRAALNWQEGRGGADIRPEYAQNLTQTNSRPTTGNTNTLLKLVGGAIIAKIMISTIAGGMNKTASEVKSNSGVEQSALTMKLMDLAIRNELGEYNV